MGGRDDAMTVDVKSFVVGAAVVCCEEVGVDVSTGVEVAESMEDVSCDEEMGARLDDAGAVELAGTVELLEDILLGYRGSPTL